MLCMVMRMMVMMMLETEVPEKRKEMSALARKGTVKSGKSPVPKKRFRVEAFEVKEAATGRVGKTIKQEVKEEDYYDGAVAEADIGGDDEADIVETELKAEVKEESESDVEAEGQDFEGHFAEAV